MKKEKKIHELHERIKTLSINSNLEECIALKKAFLELKPNQREENEYYKILRCEISLKKLEADNYSDDLIASIVDEQIEASYRLILKTNLELEHKRQSAMLARTLYDINNSQNSCLLIELEKQIKILEEIERLKTLATTVVEKIDNLETPTNLIDAQKIIEVRKTYQELEESAKIYVINIDVLLQYEKVIICMEKALEIDTLILAIPESLTLEDKSLVFEIFEKYNEMDEEEQRYVTSFEELKEAIDIINNLEKTKYNILYAKSISHQIEITYNTVFGNTDFETKEKSLNVLQEMYACLNDEQKSYLTNHELIETMEIEIARLIVIKNNHAIALEVHDKINSIPKEITEEHFEFIEKTRLDYESLTNEQKNYITNIQILISAEETVTAISNAELIDESISNLVAELSYVDQIRNVKKRYESLTILGKSYVKKYQLLKHVIAEVRKKEESYIKAKEIDQKILDISSCITSKNIVEVLRIKNDYDNLDDIGKTYVDKEYLLEEALKKVKDIQFTQSIQEAYDLLCDDVTIDEYDHVQELYNKVLGFEGFEHIETLYKVLSYQMNEVTDIITLINEIATVTIDEGDDIARIRMKYELLDDRQKNFVSNYHLLIDAEREFMKLENQEETIENEVDTYIDEQIEVLMEMKANPIIPQDKIISCENVILELYESLSLIQKSKVKNQEFFQNTLRR